MTDSGWPTPSDPGNGHDDHGYTPPSFILPGVILIVAAVGLIILLWG